MDQAVQAAPVQAGQVQSGEGQDGAEVQDAAPLVLSSKQLLGAFSAVTLVVVLVCAYFGKILWDIHKQKDADDAKFAKEVADKAAAEKAAAEVAERAKEADSYVTEDTRPNIYLEKLAQREQERAREAGVVTLVEQWAPVPGERVEAAAPSESGEYLPDDLVEEERKEAV